MKLQKTLGVSTVVAVAGVALVFPSVTSEASSGNIMDSWHRPIVGILVKVQGGRSGWAGFSPSVPGQRYSVSWNYDTQGKPFSLHIGVGGTPQNWQNNVKTRVFPRNTYGGQINIAPGNQVYTDRMP